MTPEAFPTGMYRVGPLARLNACSQIATPQANAELKVWRAKRRTQSSTFYYHWARLIEIMYALERAEQLLRDPDITSTAITDVGEARNREGVGIVEAPRGVLIHHYWVDKGDRIEKANLIVSTGHRHPLLRPVPELRHPRRRQDADGHRVAGRGRSSGGYRPPRRLSGVVSFGGSE